MLTRQAARGRILATVLFTDIVGSTEQAARLGDARWRDTLAGHHATVRRELRRFGGTERDTAGDGFFATFERPTDAVRCAAAIVEETTALGISVRASLHTGETERMDGKLGGIAVHTAARLLAEAGPGEVLVTATTRELVAGAGLTFADRGNHQLKGLPEPVHVYALEDGALLGTASTSGAGPGQFERVRRLRLATATGAVAIVAVLAIVIAAFTSRGFGSTAGPTSLPSGAGVSSGTPSGSQPPATIAVLAGNLPAVGPIPPGTYLLPAVRGDATLTVPDAFWSNYYQQWWYPSSYPETHVRFDQWQPPGSAPCGVSAPSVPPDESYERWVTWFTNHPALALTGINHRSFGDTGATQLDLTVVPERACADTGAVALDSNGNELLAAGSFVRVYVIDSPEAFLVVLEAPTKEQLQLASPELDTLLTSLRFP
jgi:class 3 adenylate cyclase